MCLCDGKSILRAHDCGGAADELLQVRLRGDERRLGVRNRRARGRGVQLPEYLAALHALSCLDVDLRDTPARLEVDRELRRHRHVPRRRHRGEHDAASGRHRADGRGRGGRRTTDLDVAEHGDTCDADEEKKIHPAEPGGAVELLDANEQVAH